MSVRLRLLGGVSVEHRGVTQRLALERPVTLLIYLCLRADWVRRTDLALLYRPHAAEDEAQNYLRKLVHRARKLDWAEGLEVEPDRLRWVVGSDVAEFGRLIGAKEWAAAVDLYRGPFLGGASVRDAPGFSSWQDLESGALKAAWLGALEALADGAMKAGRHQHAAELLGQVLEAEPLAEEQLQDYMRALAADGRPREALHAFDNFSRALNEEVGLDPLESTIALADDLRRSAPSAQAVAGPPRASLPEALTPFIGRQRELDELGRLLRSGRDRLVSIVGFGGSGKTRLAVEAARAVLQGGHCEVAYVPLTGTSDEDRLLRTLLGAFGLTAEDVDAEQALVAELQRRDLLLVLDNFEALLPAAPLLTRLLEAAPGLRLLVTTRESLQVTGEVRLELEGLDTPAAGEEVTSEYGAVRLFLQRAARASPQFAPGGGELETVGRICRLLEGMPLALELAASWTRLLTVDELHQELEAGSPVLTAELQDMPERHRSIWNVFEHTWSRLSEAERQVLTGLTVFRGGFTLAAARAVAGADLETLLAMLNRLLVRRQAEGRFVLHELIRQYAERRAEERELERARTAHSRYFTDLLSDLTADIKGAAVQQALATVQADSANFEAAWYHAVERADLDAIEGASPTLDEYFYYKGQLDAARRAFGAGLETLTPLAQAPGPAQARAARIRARLQVNVAQKEFWTGDFQAALDRLEEAGRTLAEHGTATDLARARLVQGNGLVRYAAYAEARPLFEQVLTKAAEEGDLYLEGAAHNGLANVLSYLEGDVRRAEEHYSLSLEAHTRVGNLEGVTGALTNLGACRFDLGDYAEAEHLWSEAAATAARVGFREREAALLNNLGALAEARDDLASARERFSRSLELRQELGNRIGSANVLFSRGRLATRTGRYEEARRDFQEALGLYRAQGETAGMAQCHSQLSRTFIQLGLHEDAVQHLAKATEHSLEAGSQAELLGTLYSSALLLEAHGHLAEALEAASILAEAAAGTVEVLRTQAEELMTRISQAPTEAAADERAEATPTEPGEVVGLVERLAAHLRSSRNAAGTASV